MVEGRPRRPNLATLLVLAADTGARWGEAVRCGGGTSTNRPARSGSKRRIGGDQPRLQRDTKTHQRRAVTLSSFALDWILDAGIPLRSVPGQWGTGTRRRPRTSHWIQESDSRAASAVDDRIWGVGG